MDSENLSAADFVARREADRMIERGKMIAEQNRIVEDVAFHIESYFSRGRKLDAEKIERIVAEAVSAIKVADSPFVTVEKSDDGLRQDIVFLVRSCEPSMSEVGICGRHIHIGRKRAVFASMQPSILLRRHAFERAIQRDVADWHGGLREIEAATVNAIGLLVVWRRAWVHGHMGTHQIAAPVGGGLLLGHFTSSDLEFGTYGYAISGRDAFTQSVRPSPAMMLNANQTKYLGATFATTISEDLLRTPQVMMRAAISNFIRTKRESLSIVARTVLWPHLVVNPGAGPEEAVKLIDQLERSLVAMFKANPMLFDALKNRAVQDLATPEAFDAQAAPALQPEMRMAM